MNFPKHGDFKIAVEDRIVASELCGPWNIEAAREYIRLLEATVAQHLHGERWVSLVTCRHSLQFPFDMIALLRASVEKRVKNSNQAAVAMVVAPEVEGYHVLFPAIRGIYQGLIPFEIFDTEQQARSWIKPYL